MDGKEEGAEEHSDIVDREEEIHLKNKQMRFKICRTSEQSKSVGGGGMKDKGKSRLLG